MIPKYCRIHSLTAKSLEKYDGSYYVTSGKVIMLHYRVKKMDGILGEIEDSGSGSEVSDHEV